MEIGEKLRILRRRYGLSQREMARRLQIHHTTYCRYENGKRVPSSGFLPRIAEKLDLSKEEVFDLIRVEDSEAPYGADSPESDRRRRDYVKEEIDRIDSGTLKLIEEIIELKKRQRGDNDKVVQ